MWFDIKKKKQQKKTFFPSQTLQRIQRLRPARRLLWLFDLQRHRLNGSNDEIVRRKNHDITMQHPLGLIEPHNLQPSQCCQCFCSLRIYSVQSTTGPVNGWTSLCLHTQREPGPQWEAIVTGGPLELTYFWLPLSGFIRPPHGSYFKCHRALVTNQATKHYTCVLLTHLE